MEWIDVKKQLPEDNTNCIVWLSNTDDFAECVFNSSYFKVYDNRFVFYENGGEYEYDLTENVTHWMIPTSPNQK